MNTNRFRPDPDYWDQKLANYLHDPPDKALRIPGHEERSRALLEILGGLPSPDKNCYQRADQVAAGMDRAQLPGYSPDEAKNGAVDFLRHPILTHPTGKEAPLVLDLREAQRGNVAQDMVRIIREDIDGNSGRQGLSDRFRENRPAFAPARFHYVHHALRERLAEENVAGLGGAWCRMPADTRIPDHSIWQHCALVSSLSSCFEISSEKRASLLVFSITPVQDFISRSRKLRDFWTGSLILSWLAFEGIRQVVYTLGSDHILYPSLVDQPLVNWLLARECGLVALAGPGGRGHLTGVASFPNKFVCLVPTGQEQQVAQDIQAAILKAWLELGEETLELLESAVGDGDPCLKKQFARQMESYWDFHWVACPLVDESSLDLVRLLLHEAVWQKPLEFIKASKGLPYETKREGAFYGVTHALIQSYLAAGKTYRTDHRKEEPGIKCNLHGDLEALRFDWKGGDRNPRPRNDPFWSTLKKAWQTTSDFKPSERLSAVATVKRLAYRVCQEMPDHPLRPFFRKADVFPSTTEMALADWLDRIEKKGLSKEFPDPWRKKMAQYLHETEAERREREEGPVITELTSEERSLCRNIVCAMEESHDPVQDEDRYYAILVMDGDHMGRLVNGETLAATWQTALHPDLVERMNDPAFDSPYRDFWQHRFNQSRLLSPAVHTAISEALGDFALRSVPSIINNHRGQLIYAGGDDVCAVLPVSTVVQAAREIARVYSLGFVMVDKTGPVEIPGGTWQPAEGRLALHLGTGDNISISAGILIAHHKKPLSVVMRRAHELLHLAKKKGKRNGLALELEKRSGGGRIFLAHWNEMPLQELQLEQVYPSVGNSCLLDHFMTAGAAMGNPGRRSMSVSLAYRLEQFRPGLEAILRLTPQELVKFLAKQVERSGKVGTSDKDSPLPGQVAALLARRNESSKTVELDTDSLIVAKFVGTRIGRFERHKEVSHG